MKTVVINDYGGYSFIYELALHLSFEYKVYYVYCSASGSTKGNKYEDTNNLKCVDLNDQIIDKSNFIKRLFVEVSYGRMLKNFLSDKIIDVVISANTPVIPQYFLQRYCQKNKIKFIFWLQDIISIAVKSVFEKKSKLLAEFFYKLWMNFEKPAIQKADKVIIITKDFIEFLNGWKVDKNKIIYIPNWASLNSIVPLPKENSFSSKHNLTESFNVLYSGTLGYKQNPQIFYTLAGKLNNHNIKIIVVSEGIGMNFLKEKLKDNPIDNLILLPYQPKALLSEVYASADVILSILEKSAGSFSVPSKVWSAYCAGKPSILIVPQNNLAAKITNEIKAGIVFDNDNSNALFEVVLHLKNNPDELKVYGSNARKYAEENFDINKISQNFVKLIES